MVQRENIRVQCASCIRPRGHTCLRLCLGTHHAKETQASERRNIGVWFQGQGGWFGGRKLQHKTAPLIRALTLKVRVALKGYCNSTTVPIP